MHLALAAVRRHRTRGAGVLSPFVLPSVALAVAPWIWPTPAGLAGGLGAHVLWFAICEWLAPPLALLQGRPSEPAAAPGAARAPRPAAADRATVPTPPRTPGFVTTPVLGVLDETPDVKTFRLARPPDFDFVAGQFVAVRVQVDGKPHVRCYSISSPPDVRGYLEISVRRQGLVSTTLHATLRAGSMLAINRPAGQFIYPAQDDRPLALIAGGIGITPLIAMLRHAVASDPTRPVVLLYSARDERDLAFLDDLRLIARRHTQVHVAATLTRPSSASHWRCGRIDIEMVRQHVPHVRDTVFCICGPAQMIAGVEQMLAETGVPRGQIRSERFETAVAASSLTAPATEGASPAAAASDTATAAFRVTFAVTGTSGVASTSSTLLEAAEASGVVIGSSCRSGVCQACRTRLLDGDADCRSDVLDPEDRASGFILPCVSWATRDCVLEA